jgi:hypothetical protein
MIVSSKDGKRIGTRKLEKGKNWLQICFIYEVPEAGNIPINLIRYDAEPVPIDRCRPGTVNQLCHCDLSPTNIRHVYNRFNHRRKTKKKTHRP